MVNKLRNPEISPNIPVIVMLHKNHTRRFCATNYAFWIDPEDLQILNRGYQLSLTVNLNVS